MLNELTNAGTYQLRNWSKLVSFFYQTQVFKVLLHAEISKEINEKTFTFISEMKQQKKQK